MLFFRDNTEILVSVIKVNPVRLLTAWMNSWSWLKTASHKFCAKRGLQTCQGKPLPSPQAPAEAEEHRASVQHTALGWTPSRAQGGRQKWSCHLCKEQESASCFWLWLSPSTACGENAFCSDKASMGDGWMHRSWQSKVAKEIFTSLFPALPPSLHCGGATNTTFVLLLASLPVPAAFLPALPAERPLPASLAIPAVPLVPAGAFPSPDAAHLPTGHVGPLGLPVRMPSGGAGDGLQVWPMLHLMLPRPWWERPPLCLSAKCCAQSASLQRHLINPRQSPEPEKRCLHYSPTHSGDSVIPAITTHSSLLLSLHREFFSSLCCLRNLILIFFS